MISQKVLAYYELFRQQAINFHKYENYKEVDRCSEERKKLAKEMTANEIDLAQHLCYAYNDGHFDYL